MEMTSYSWSVYQVGVNSFGKGSSVENIIGNININFYSYFSQRKVISDDIIRSLLVGLHVLFSTFQNF